MNTENLLSMINTTTTTAPIVPNITSTSPNFEPLNLSTSSIINTHTPLLPTSTSLLNTNGSALHQNVVASMQAQQFFLNQFKFNPGAAAAAAMMLNFQNAAQANNNNAQTQNASIPSTIATNAVAINAMNALLINAMNNTNQQRQLAAHFQRQQQREQQLQQQTPLLAQLGINFNANCDSTMINNRMQRVTSSNLNKSHNLSGILDSTHQPPPMKVFYKKK